MPSRWKYPRYGEAWGLCQWCGQEYPSSQVWLNPRYGWQCYKCWDGLIQRDQYLQPIFPYEGTRRTPAPPIPVLEGVGASTLEPSYEYFLRDRITGTVYDVHFPPFGIVDGLIVYFTTTLPTLTVSTETDNVWDGLRGITSGWDVYVRNGALATEINPPVDLEIVDGICDFGSIPSNCTINMVDVSTGNLYSVNFSTIPITVTANPGATGAIFNAVQVGNGFYIVLNSVLTAYPAAPTGLIYANDCIAVDELVGAPTTTPGSIPVDDGGGPTPSIPNVSCPTTVITDLGVDFTAVVVVESGDSVVSYLWDYGDGSTETTLTSTVHHDYDATGTYDVIVTVTTASGGTGSSTACPVSVVAGPGDGPPLPGSCIPTFGTGTGTPNSAFEISGTPYTILVGGGPSGQTTVEATVPITVRVKCDAACTNNSGDFWFQMGGTYTSCFCPAGAHTNTHLTLTVYEYTQSDCGDAPIIVATTAHSQGGFDGNYYQSIIGTKGSLQAGRHYVFEASMAPGNSTSAALYDVFLKFSVTDPGLPPTGDTYLGQCC